MAGLRVGQAYGGVPPTWVWVVGVSPQILEHPTSICDTGVNFKIILCLIGSQLSSFKIGVSLEYHIYLLPLLIELLRSTDAEVYRSDPWVDQI